MFDQDRYRLVITYGRPRDPEQFDDHYRKVHAPLAAALPGLLSFTATKVVEGDQYLVAALDFESAEAFGAALASDQGQRASADLSELATGGLSMLHGPTSVMAGAAS